MDTEPRFRPPKGTGGAGFAFEDRVVAYIAACLMADSDPWPGAGRILRIECQRANQGWHPDDVLLTLEAREGRGPSYQCRCAGSIKDMAPITGDGFAAATGFREEAWRLHSGEIRSEERRVGKECR